MLFRRFSMVEKTCTPTIALSNNAFASHSSSICTLSLARRAIAHELGIALLHASGRPESTVAHLPVSPPSEHLLTSSTCVYEAALSPKWVNIALLPLYRRRVYGHFIYVHYYLFFRFFRVSRRMHFLPTTSNRKYSSR